MKSVRLLITLLAGMFIMRLAQAQGTPYLSSIPPRGGATSRIPFRSNIFLSQGFITGTNPGGYLLDSVAMKLVLPEGPSNLTVSLYDFDANLNRPGSAIDALELSLTPADTYAYIYVGSDLVLLPNTIYFLGLTTGSQVLSRWSLTDHVELASDGWAFYGRYYEYDGNSAFYPHDYFQMDFYATAVPEPAAGVLFVLGLVGLGFWRRRNRPTLKP